MSYSPTVVKSAQQGTIATVANSATNVATITAVNTNTAVLTLLGQNTGALDGLYRITLTNSTTVTATRGTTVGAGPTLSYRVVEFY
jgi:hypothetical protein